MADFETAQDAPAGVPARARRVIKKKILTRDDHQIIQQKVGISGEEDYAAVFMRGKGYGQWSIHVFTRQPMQREIDAYEQTASKLQFKGQKAKMEGSQINAAVTLYNLLIARAYDVLAGMQSHDNLPRERAITTVPPLVKREAVRQLIGEVYGESRMAEIEGADEDDDDDSEDHT